MQLLEVCRATKAQILKSIIKKKKKWASVVEKKDSVNAAHRQKATVKVNAAESEQNLFAYENSWALMALDWKLQHDCERTCVGYVCVFRFTSPRQEITLLSLPFPFHLESHPTHSRHTHNPTPWHTLMIPSCMHAYWLQWLPAVNLLLLTNSPSSFLFLSPITDSSRSPSHDTHTHTHTRRMLPSPKLTCCVCTDVTL